MRQQVLDGDTASARVVPVHVLRHVVVERELARVHQLKNRGGRELLRHGPDAEHHVRLEQNPELEIRQPIGTAEHRAPVLDNDGHRARGVLRIVSGEERVGTGREPRGHARRSW